MKPHITPIVAAIAIALLTPHPSPAGDWPQWLGPHRNNTAPDEKIADAWPATGPKRVWSIPVGQGFAAPSIADGHLILFHRLDDRDTVDALDPATGQRRWRYQYPSRFLRSMVGDRGPRSAPAVHNGRVYTYGAQGMVHCLDLKTGAVVWAVDTAERFDTDPGFFGRLSSPLIHNNLLLLNVGGEENAGIVALNTSDGSTAWTATDHEASYSSPTLFEHDGQTRAVFFTRTGLVVLDPDTGAVQASRYFRSAQHASVNAATPLAHGGRIFATSSYDVGAGLFAFTGDELLPVWS
ncbi:MAG: outer membrane protein assembly factor BamB family protein, partial [Planctomycetota bacterium]